MQEPEYFSGRDRCASGLLGTTTFRGGYQSIGSASNFTGSVIAPAIGHNELDRMVDTPQGVDEPGQRDLFIKGGNDDGNVQSGTSQNMYYVNSWNRRRRRSSRYRCVKYRVGLARLFVPFASTNISTSFDFTPLDPVGGKDAFDLAASLRDPITSNSEEERPSEDRSSVSLLVSAPAAARGASGGVTTAGTPSII